DRWRPMAAPIGVDDGYAMNAFPQTAIWTGSEVLVWGIMEAHPEGDHNLLSDRGARYDPLTDAWRATSSANAPASVVGKKHAFWTGQSMLIWGGEGCGGRCGDGAAYDPTSDTWVPLPNDGAPSARSRQSAIWTGQELLVWGGTDGTKFLSDGARFNPNTGKWT